MFGKRFREWRKVKGVTAYRIAKLTGVHPSFISNIEAGRRPMSESFMRKLADIETLDLSYETLRAWELESEYDPATVAVYQQMRQSEPSTSPPQTFSMEALEGLYRVPLKMKVQAGPLTQHDVIEEQVYIDWYGLKEVSTDLFCMQVQGDSMWPPIPDGAIILVREVDTLQNGEKYVVETDDNRMTFKLVEFNKDGAYLTPLNPTYAPIPLGDARLKRLYRVLSYKVDWS